MKQTLKQRIIPEVDERKLDRESSKVSSYVEESLKELTPGLSGSEMFGTDDLFDDLEDMEDMTDDFFGDDPFSLDGSDGFAGDVVFGDGPAEMTQDAVDDGGMVEDLSQVVGNKSSKGKGGMGDKLTDIGQKLTKNNKLTGTAAKATTALGKIFVAGGATILLGGFALAMLSGIWSRVRRISQHSPLLETVVSLMSMITTFLIRPFAHMIGQMLLPIMMDLLHISAEFMSISFEDGIWEGVKFLGSTLLDALFSLPGLIATSITGVGAILGGLIGLKAAKILGGLLGGILGSVIPGAGTAAGAAIGATIGGTLFGILGVLTAYNIDEIVEFLRDVASSLDIVRFIAFAILGPFGLLAMAFFGWMKDRFNDFMELWGEIQQDGVFSAVFDVGDFDVWDNIEDGWDGWPEAIWEFSIWSDIYELFTGEGGWAQKIWEFSIWSDIYNGWDGWPTDVFTFGVWGGIEEDWDEWPEEIWEFTIWSDIYEMFTDEDGDEDGWPEAIWEFSIWSDVYEMFTDEGGWPERIWEFSIWSNIFGEWDGWPSDVFTFDVWDNIEDDWGGWPEAIWEFSIWSNIYELFTGEGGWPERIWRFSIWSDVFEEWDGWPSDVFTFDVWDNIEGEFDGWPERIWRFSIWSDIYDLFTGEGGWPERIWRFSIWSDVFGEWDGWPSDVFTFGVWDRIENRFDGWPNVRDLWPGWDEFVPEIDWNLSGFDWGSDFIPSISWDIDPFPGWGDIVDGVTSGVSGAFNSFRSSSGSGADPGTGGGDGSGGGSGGGGGGGGPPGRRQREVGFMASGGIVEDTFLTFVGEGRESEVVAPLSKLDSMIDNRATARSVESSMGSERDTERQLREAVEGAGADVDDDEIIRQLKKMVRAINGLDDTLELDVDFEDRARWEVRE